MRLYGPGSVSPLPSRYLVRLSSHYSVQALGAVPAEKLPPSPAGQMLWLWGEPEVMLEAEGPDLRVTGVQPDPDVLREAKSSSPTRTP